MTRRGDRAINKHNCLLCAQEISAKEEIPQPNNPRKVFKVCCNYLKPEVFIKYSKWDYLSSLERQSPFCSMCVKSGEKLCIMNDRLEEMQKEIKRFVKYFVKEIHLLCNSSDEDEETPEDEDYYEDGRKFRASRKASLRSSSSKKEDEILHPRVEPSSKMVIKSTTVTNAEEDLFPGDYEPVVIKHENEELESAGIDEDYQAPSSAEEEDDEDEEYKPCKKQFKPEENSKKPKSNVPEKKRKSFARVQWKQITYSEEQLKLEWTRKSLNNGRGNRNISEYFYCKIGGKKCPAKLLKRYYGGIRYYENGKDHCHFKTKNGVSQEVKLEIQKILEDDPMIRPDFILDILKTKGIEIEKSKLKNVLLYERRKILIKSGMCEQVKALQNSDCPAGQKRKRGRPSGSRSIIIPVPPKAEQSGSSAATDAIISQSSPSTTATTTTQLNVPVALT